MAAIDWGAILAREGLGAPGYRETVEVIKAQRAEAAAAPPPPLKPPPKGKRKRRR